MAKSNSCPDILNRIEEKYPEFHDLKDTAGCRIQSFDIGKSKVEFVLIQYGEMQDCMAGCFSSHACFIIDEKDLYPYSFAFYGTGEDFIRLHNEKPGYVSEFCSNSRNCKTHLTGILHALAETPEIQAFREKDILNGGNGPYFSEFRWCMY